MDQNREYPKVHHSHWSINDQTNQVTWIDASSQRETKQKTCSWCGLFRISPAATSRNNKQMVVWVIFDLQSSESLYPASRITTALLKAVSNCNQKKKKRCVLPFASASSRNNQPNQSDCCGGRHPVSSSKETAPPFFLFFFGSTFLISREMFNGLRGHLG